MTPSRLERRSKRKLAYTLILIVVLGFLFVRFGLPLLANVGIFIAGFGGESQTQGESQEEFVAPPVLDPLPDATNQQTIDVSGKASKDQTVVLFVNDEEKEETRVGSNDSFRFLDISLDNGENEIKAKAKEGESESEFSEALIISKITKNPELSINTPKENEEIRGGLRRVDVTGKTDPGARVTVNDFWAIVDGNGNFSYSLSLVDGENRIKIIAEDEAGNKTEKEFSVKFSP